MRERGFGQHAKEIERLPRMSRSIFLGFKVACGQNPFYRGVEQGSEIALQSAQACCGGASIDLIPACRRPVR
jgi:hypothetical protein